MDYRVTETATGRLIVKDDTVTDFRGDTGTFSMVSRGPMAGKDAKVIVGGREYYARVFGLTVQELEAAQ
jgi:hypothetical protein